MHTCAVRTDGTLACWGYNAYGQTNAPAGVFTQISLGDHFACGLRSDGTVTCWGDNGYAQSRPISVAPTSLPLGNPEQSYSQTISASGGTSPYAFKVADGSLPPGLTLTAGGYLNGTPTTPGTYSFTLQASDSFYGLSFSGQRAYTVIINDPPTGGDAAVSLTEDTSRMFSSADFPYADPSGDALAGIRLTTLESAGDLECAGLDVAVDGLCADLSQLEFTPEPDGNGNPYATFGFRLRDARGAFSTLSYTMTVNVSPFDDAPVLSEIGDQIVEETTEITFTATADDPDLPADLLTFGLGAGAPAGASIDPASGEFAWTPDEMQGASVFTFTVWVTDTGTPSLDDFETFQIEVIDTNAAPLLSDIGNQSVNEQHEITFTASAADSDFPVDSLTLSLDAGAPAGAAFDPASGVFEWTPTEDQGPGTYTVTVRVTDDGTPALSDFETFQIEVGEFNTAPTLDEIEDQSGDELTEIAFTASAADDDTPANDLTFSLDSGAPVGASIDPATGEFEWTPTENQGPGTYTVTVRVTDDGTPALSDFDAITIEVGEVNTAPALDEIGDQSGDELTEIAFTALVDDPDLPANDLIFSLDPGAPDGSAIDPITGEFTWTPDEMQGSNVFTFTVRVTDDGTPVLDDFETFQIEVSEGNTAPVAADDAYETVEDTPLVVAALGVLGNDSDSDIPVQTLTATLVSAPVEGELALELDGSFIYTPSLNFNGVINFTYRVSDGELFADGFVEITVAPLNDLPEVDAGGDLNSVEGSPVQFSGSYLDPGRRNLNAVEIAWDFGDGTGTEDDLEPQHTYPQDGVFTATLTITDELGGVGMDWLVVTVTNAAPELDAVLDQDATAGAPMTVDITFSDPGVLDEYILQIAWGDGLTETFELEAGVYGLEITHVYARAGAYSPTVNVRDDGGAEDEVSFAVQVIRRLWMPVLRR